MIHLLTFALLNLLGIISPGPDFAIVARFGLTGSRKSALLASLGITTAIFIHVFYCMSGIALFLQSAPNALKIVRLLGAIYLGYLGIKMLFEEFRENHKEAQVIPKHRAFLAGFTTNLLNPKATVFMLSLFSQFADSYSTWNMKIAFGLCIPLIAISWFSLLSCLLTHPTFLPHLQANKRRFTILMSGVLILLGAFGLLTTFTA